MEHILIGKNLLLKVDCIESALIETKDEQQVDCIKVRMTNGTEWTIRANILKSRLILRSIPKINDQYELIEELKRCVYKNRVGRESKVIKEIKSII